MNPVHRAILATPKDYLRKTLEQRAGLGLQTLGSFYEDLTPMALLGMLIFEQRWELYTHVNVVAPAKAYMARIPGFYEMVHISEVSEAESIIVVDPKGLGHGQAAVQVRPGGTKRGASRAEFSVALIGSGKKLGVEEDILWTVHPGDPVRPTELSSDLIGKTLTIHEARGLGVEWLKTSP